ncbi:signal peptidase II [Dichelobacter nodosus]|uniref:Lipoprotein signal peptidase n=1 Tax=Dichelobacter nodosus (strain VCS1703A) TaxID=246195 RepID=LSPA_DICNV|nr:signal peptidase II [Dichelobacter nodosus]A5EWT1.1 RecName: Full=Lipoprotein signal peptidase; AltName: Full=Prolipoprotein signal peptidase; AltName: Full=Signal peptidase II; Short=SPase II [Dichelobacter nodosus VCS1703A]ABQ13650.1 signal peptidase II [Dichelobacter nodosus VCS1703A]AXM45016.1 lipoprotein signal peptidase [Dichelobacter nodosus]KNZ39705.1 signal peptidase [Dichelobacter nodosus]TGA65865.1 lipoprotein signal peptidase [Dichelobacter nodosus]
MNWAKRSAFFLISVACFLADYYSKYWALTELGARKIVVNTYMNFILAFNHGAAFSFLARAGGWQRWLFAGFAGIVALWLIMTLLTKSHHWLMSVSYACILGGAVGNLYDRVVYGYVIDFIQWHYRTFYWPVFNLADVAITLGVILMLIAELHRR